MKKADYAPTITPRKSRDVKKLGSPRTKRDFLAFMKILAADEPQTYAELWGENYSDEQAKRTKDRLRAEGLIEVEKKSQGRGRPKNALAANYTWLTNLLETKLDLRINKEDAKEQIKKLYNTSVVRDRVLHPRYELITIEEETYTWAGLLNNKDISITDLWKLYTCVLINYPIALMYGRAAQETTTFSVRTDYTMRVAFMEADNTDSQLAQDLFSGDAEMKMWINEETLGKEDKEVIDKKLDQASSASLEVLDEVRDELLPRWVATFIPNLLNQAEERYDPEQHEGVNIGVKSEFMTTVGDIIYNNSDIAESL